MIETLIDMRSRLRKERRFDLADEIRTRLKDLGVIIEDRKEGSVWRVS